MNNLFEKSDALNNPIECFYYNASDMDFPIKPHWHYFMELIYVIEGEAEIQSGSCSFTAKKGDLVLFHPKSIHSISSEAPEALMFAAVKLDINRINMPSDYAPKMRSIFRSAERRGMDIFFPKAAADKMKAEKIFRSCISEINTQRYGFDGVIRSELLLLLTAILRAWQDSGFTVDSEVFAIDEEYDIYSITEYIEDNISSGIKVSDIAEMCGMSYSYFAKLFQRVYGKTCKEYMEEMRITKAQEFLIFTDFDLTYISQETGFSDCSHLIKSFRSRLGVTPRQFRSSNKAKSL